MAVISDALAHSMPSRLLYSVHSKEVIGAEYSGASHAGVRVAVMQVSAPGRAR